MQKAGSNFKLFLPEGTTILLPDENRGLLWGWLKRSVRCQGMPPRRRDPGVAHSIPGRCSHKDHRLALLLGISFGVRYAVNLETARVEESNCASLVRQLCAGSAESKDAGISRFDGSRDRFGLVIPVENLPVSQVQGAIGNVKYCHETLDRDHQNEDHHRCHDACEMVWRIRSNHLPGTDSPCVRNWDHWDGRSAIDWRCIVFIGVPDLILELQKEP